MLQLQEQLQTEVYGHNFQRMLPADRIQYIKEMKLALEAELQEALDHTGWKLWATSKHINREEYFGELVDAFHFLMNMLLALGDTPEDIASELFTRYCIKNRVNAQRQQNGYDGVTTKCGLCGVALDDMGVRCWKKGNQGYCFRENADVNYITSGDSVGPAVVVTPVKSLKVNP